MSAESKHFEINIGDLILCKRISFPYYGYAKDPKKEYQTGIVVEVWEDLVRDPLKEDIFLNVFWFGFRKNVIVPKEIFPTSFLGLKAVWESVVVEHT